MSISYVPPNADRGEPVYLYDDPNLYPIVLEGQRVNQRGLNLRMVVSTPRDIDRICKVPVLSQPSNMDYATNWAGGGGGASFQRNYDVDRLSDVSTWWAGANAKSANPVVIWLPAAHQFTDSHNSNSTNVTITPSIWCVQTCATCGADASQYPGHVPGEWFDCCHACGWVGRTGLMIDGQHRIRGMAFTPAGAPPAVPPWDVEIFISALSQAAPGATTYTVAANIFIEINSGAKKLDGTHEHYLASKFGLLQYVDPRRVAAYDIARSLNLAAANDDWYTDTGATPRFGRVKMMGDVARSDFHDVDTLAEWIHDEAWTREVEVPDSGIAGATITVTPLSPPAIIRAATYTTLLQQYLRAATNVWPGTAGVRTPPRWCSNRSTVGDLQERRVIRTLLNILPNICARIDEQGLARNVATFETELRAIENLTWDGDWNSWLTGDAGINRVTAVVRQIYKGAPYPTPVDSWPNLVTWYGSAHDAMTMTSLDSSITGLTFETQCTNPNDGSTWVRSLVSRKTVTVVINNMTTGTKETAILNASSTGPSSLNFEEHSISVPTVGDTLTVQVTYTTHHDSTPVTVTDTCVVA